MLLTFSGHAPVFGMRMPRRRWFSDEAEARYAKELRWLNTLEEEEVKSRLSLQRAWRPDGDDVFQRAEHHVNSVRQALRTQKVEKAMAFLSQQEFRPGEKYRDLLLALPPMKQALAYEHACYQKDMQRYLQLNWLQRFFAKKPTPKPDYTSIPMTELEVLYRQKSEQAQLFCALCELHDRELITLSEEGPSFFIDLTPLGGEAIARLKAGDAPWTGKYPEPPPAYDALSPPPYPGAPVYEKQATPKRGSSLPKRASVDSLRESLHFLHPTTRSVRTSSRTSSRPGTAQ